MMSPEMSVSCQFDIRTVDSFQDRKNRHMDVLLVFYMLILIFSPEDRDIVVLFVFFQCWFLFSHPWTPCPGGFQACKVRFQSEQIQGFQRCPMGEIQTGAKPEVQPLNLFWPWKTLKRTLFTSSFIVLNIFYYYSFPNFPFQRGWKSDQDVSGSQEVPEAAYTHSSQK